MPRKATKKSNRKKTLKALKAQKAQKAHKAKKTIKARKTLKAQKAKKTIKARKTLKALKAQNGPHQLIPEFQCVGDWKLKRPMRILGKGAKGSVYFVCERDCADEKALRAAAKIERLKNKKDVLHFEKEVKNQKAFEGIAPKIHTSCVLRKGAQRWGLIVMELIDSTLDKYLVKKRSPEELNSVSEQLASILSLIHI